MAKLPDGDASVLALPRLERCLLWAIRTWSAYHDEPQVARRSLDRCFIEAGIQPALRPFEQVMSALFADWRYWPDIRCVRCLRLGRGERALLQLFYLLQQKQNHDAVLIIKQLINSASVAFVQTAAEGLVSELSQSRLRLCGMASHSTGR